MRGGRGGVRGLNRRALAHCQPQPHAGLKQNEWGGGWDCKPFTQAAASPGPSASLSLMPALTMAMSSSRRCACLNSLTYS